MADELESSLALVVVGDDIDIATATVDEKQALLPLLLLPCAARELCALLSCGLSDFVINVKNQRSDKSSLFYFKSSLSEGGIAGEGEVEAEEEGTDEEEEEDENADDESLESAPGRFDTARRMAVIWD